MSLKKCCEIILLNANPKSLKDGSLIEIVPAETATLLGMSYGKWVSAAIRSARSAMPDLLPHRSLGTKHQPGMEGLHPW